MYKKIIISALILLSPTLVFADTAIVGTQWKQIDTTLYPADDVTEVSFTGYSTSGLSSGIQEGTDVGFGNITATSITTSGAGKFGNISGANLTVDEIHGYDLMLRGTFGSGTSLDVAGGGTRCFYYPKKAAWRCGAIVGTQWDDANIGNYSYAEGYNTTASGLVSHAEGDTTTATNTRSHAEGYVSNATGTASHAEGDNTDATANGAHSEGSSTLASGTASHAEGLNTTASASYAHVEGGGSTASGNASHAEGFFTVASGTNSHSGGSYVKVTGTNSYIFGNYANATERDANPLSKSSSFKLANTSLFLPFNNISSELSPYTVATGKYSFDCDANAGNVTFNLMSSSTVVGMGLEITKVDSSANKCYVEGAGSETISGFTTYSGLDTQWESILIRANTTRWTIKASY